MPSGDHRRLSPEEKTRAVLRSIRGESAEALAAELRVSPERIASWESAFLKAGQAALESSKRSHQSGLKKSLHRIAPWTTLILLLFIIVYFLTRFVGSGSGEPSP
jgi:transposase-like protein